MCLYFFCIYNTSLIYIDMPSNQFWLFKPIKINKYIESFLIPVKHGDAFIIECVRGDTQGVVVVDGGPRSCGFELKRKLNELGTPDLMVLTHYDEDHIGGILQLVNTCLDDNMIPAKEVWETAQVT